MAGNDSKRGRTALSVILLTLTRSLALILTMAVSVLLANRLGAGVSTDAFFFVRRLTGSINEAIRRVVQFAYIPSFVRLLRSGETQPLAAIRRSHLARAILIVLFTSTLVAIFAPWVVQIFVPGFDDVRSLLSVKLLRILAFIVPVGMVVAILITLFFAANRFGAELVRLTPRLLVLPFLLLAVPPFGVEAVSWVLLGGTFLSAIYLIWKVPSLIALIIQQSETRSDADSALVAPESTDDPPVIDAKGRVLPAILWQFHVHISGFIDVAYASTLAIGALSQFEFGQRLVTIPSRVVTSSMNTVMYSTFAQKAADTTAHNLRKSIIRHLRIGLFVMAPLAVFVWSSAEPLVDLLLRHGAFTKEAAEQTASVIRFFAPTVVFVFLANTIILGLYSDPSIPHIKPVVSVVCGSFVVRFIALTLLVGPLGIIGIALASTVTSGLVVLFTAICLFHYWGPVITSADYIAIAKILGCTGIAGIGMYAARTLFVIPSPNEWIFHLSVLMALAASGTLVYVCTAMLFRIQEFHIVLKSLRRITRVT